MPSSSKKKQTEDSHATSSAWNIDHTRSIQHGDADTHGQSASSVSPYSRLTPSEHIEGTLAWQGALERKEAKIRRKTSKAGLTRPRLKSESSNISDYASANEVAPLLQGVENYYYVSAPQLASASSSAMDVADGSVSNIREAEDEGPSKLKVSLMLVILVATRSIDYVFYVRLANDMERYTWYLGTVALCCAFCCIAWPIVLLRYHWKIITPKMLKEAPLKLFAIMACFDCGQNVLSTIPAATLPGPLQVIFSQFVIPVNMLASAIFLRARYRWTHYIAVLLILAGVVVAVLPSLDNTKESAMDSVSPFTLSIMIGMLLLSNIPATASNVYKELELKNVDTDIWLFNAWIAVFQLLVGFLTSPLIFIKAFAGGVVVTPSTFFTYMWNATKCFGGINPTPLDTHCSETPYVFACFVIFNFTYNIVILYVFKHGSATLAVIASALRVALSDFLFEWAFLAGPATHQLSTADYVSLAVLLVGLIMYRWYPEDMAVETRKDVDDILAGRQAVQSYATFSLLDTREFQGEPYLLIDEIPYRPGPRSASQVRANLYHRVGLPEPTTPSRSEHSDSGSSSRRHPSPRRNDPGEA
eukprot:Clim_evm23s156 gene=Clim_evmTU23s156